MHRVIEYVADAILIVLGSSDKSDRGSVLFVHMWLLPKGNELSDGGLSFRFKVRGLPQVSRGFLEDDDEYENEFRNLRLSELPLKPFGSAADVAGGGFREMRGEAGCVILRSIGKDPFTRGLTGFWKFAIDGAEIRTVYLQRMMHDVTQEQSFLSIGAKPNGSMVHAVPGCW